MECKKPKEQEGSLPGSKDRRLRKTQQSAFAVGQVEEGHEDTLGATCVHATQLWLQVT